MTAFSALSVVAAVVLAYVIGFNHGVYSASGQYQSVIANLLRERLNVVLPTPYPAPTPEVVVNLEPAPPREVNWGGPELWRVVNDERVKHGVNPLEQKDELCTIASIRLNELLELEKLDGHEGFSKLVDNRDDLKWIFEKYNVAEFLASGADTPQETVELWLNTLAHKKLITGGEYSFGCVYAQNTFAVAIAAFE